MHEPSYPSPVAAVQVMVLSAPAALYPLHKRVGWLRLLSDLFFLCTAAVHVYLSIRPTQRYLRTALCGTKVCPVGFTRDDNTGVRKYDLGRVPARQSERCM
jgi:hypothetical protein